MSVLINPTREQVEFLVRKTVDAANHGARQRLVDMPTGTVIDSIRLTEEGHYEDDGGGVPNSYRYRAETSILGIAWATDGNGRKHVVVIGGRVDAPKSAHGRRRASVFAPPSEAKLLTPFEMIYPELRVNHRVKTYKGADRHFVQALAENPLDVATRMAYADWLVERGKTYEAERHHKALVVLRDVLGLVDSPCEQPGVC